MVSVVKSEWHQVEKRYGLEIDTNLLSEIYPELDEDEIEAKLAELESGEEDVETVLNDAWDNNVDIDWDYLNEDDWWTDRKGGYEVTYTVEEWEVRQDYVSPITHKCVKCKWTGSRYDAEWKWTDDNGNELDEAIKVCPMCDSDTELTEVGIEEEKKDAENKARWASIEDEDQTDPEIQATLEELKAEFDRIVIEEDKPNKD
jgi:hypothetical protein